MASELHYRSNLRDVEFNLFEYLRVQDDVLGHGPFAEFDEATARETLRAYEVFCRNELAKSFASADREGLKFDVETGSVTLPAGLKRPTTSGTSRAGRCWRCRRTWAGQARLRR